MKRYAKITAIVTALAIVATAQVSLAQGDAGAKARGEYNFWGKSTSRSMYSARDYAQDYRTYTQTAPQVDKAVAQETADSIGQYIVKAQKHMAWMRKHAAHDKEAIASLDVIDKSLVEAAKSHHTLHEHCLKEHVETKATVKCCDEISESLSKAIIEHDKLMKRLGLPNPTAKPKK